MRRRRSSSGLGAAADDPVAIATRALREAATAVREKDDIGLRQAAEKGWLAVSSAADVAAAHLGMKQPGGAKSRRQVLDSLERAARLRVGTLLNPFEAARAVLHGECFHGGECPPPRGILGLLDEAKNMTEDTVRTLGRLRPRQRR